MSSSCDEVDDILENKHTEQQRGTRRQSESNSNSHQDVEHGQPRPVCDWGFDGDDSDGAHLDDNESESDKFIPIYERYIADKKSIVLKTQNYKLYANNPQKSLRDWFESEGHVFTIETEQTHHNKFICKVDIPLGEHDFTLTSELHEKKKDATDEICLAACQMLDDCQLLYPWQASSDKSEVHQKRIHVGHREDDIEYDRTVKRPCLNDKDDKTSGQSSKIREEARTYTSLMAEWNQVNMRILQMKAELAKLDLSLSKCDGRNTAGELPSQSGQPTTENQTDDNSEDDEVDPLDEYMSSLNEKTKLTMDDKIEKSRLKNQITAHEKELADLSRLIELAKPTFDLNKAVGASGHSSSQI